MRLPKRLLTAIVPLAALAIAGCGGGGSSGTTATTQATTSEKPATLSKAELIQQGDAICAEVNVAVGAEGTTETGVAEKTTKVSDLYVGMVKSLERLGRPESPAGGYSEFMEAAENLAKVEGEVKLAAEREESAALGEAATKATPALEEFQTAAGSYGFKKCSEGPSAPTQANGTGSGAGAGGTAPEGSPGAVESEVSPETPAPAPETGGAAGAPEETPPAGGGTGAGGGGGQTGGSSGGIGPG